MLFPRPLYTANYSFKHLLSRAVSGMCVLYLCAVVLQRTFLCKVCALIDIAYIPTGSKRNDCYYKKGLSTLISSPKSVVWSVDRKMHLFMAIGLIETFCEEAKSGKGGIVTLNACVRDLFLQLFVVDISLWGTLTLLLCFAYRRTGSDGMTRVEKWLQPIAVSSVLTSAMETSQRCPVLLQTNVQTRRLCVFNSPWRGLRRG